MVVRLIKGFRGRGVGVIHDYPDSQALKMVESGIAVREDGDSTSDESREKPRKGKGK